MQTAMQHIKSLVGDEIGQELYDLWQVSEDQFFTIYRIDVVGSLSHVTG